MGFSFSGKDRIEGRKGPSEAVNRPKEEMKWQCPKCKKMMSKDDMTELFGWGIWVCDACVEAWLNEF